MTRLPRLDTRPATTEQAAEPRDRDARTRPADQTAWLASVEAKLTEPELEYLRRSVAKLDAQGMERLLTLEPDEAARELRREMGTRGRDH